MGIYRAKIAGRKKPVLLKADNKTGVKDRVVTDIELLTTDDLEAALEAGETVWKAGEDLPPDEVDEPAGPAAAAADEAEDQ
jgi:hypothetical protein